MTTMPKMTDFIQNYVTVPLLSFLESLLLFVVQIFQQVETNSTTEGNRGIPKTAPTSTSSTTNTTSVQRIIENKKYIDTILHYWFVQYGPPDQAQKKLWMISEQQQQPQLVSVVPTKQITNTTNACNTAQMIGSTCSSQENGVICAPTTVIDPKVNIVSGYGTQRWREWYGLSTETTDTFTASATACSRKDDDHDDANESRYETVHNHEKNNHKKLRIYDNNINNKKKKLEQSLSHSHHSLYGYQGKLAAIIVLDQFSRHTSME
jgi:hypothetical protein